MQRSSDCAIAILAAILSVNSCFSIHKVLYNPLGWAWEGASLFMSPFQWHQRRLNPSVKQACERVRLSVPWRAQLSVIHSLSWEKKRWKSTAREQSRCIEIQSRKTQSATYSSVVQEHFLSMYPALFSKQNVTVLFLKSAMQFLILCISIG